MRTSIIKFILPMKYKSSSHKGENLLDHTEKHYDRF